MCNNSLAVWDMHHTGPILVIWCGISFMRRDTVVTRAMVVSESFHSAGQRADLCHVFLGAG